MTFFQIIYWPHRIFLIEMEEKYFIHLFEQRNSCCHLIVCEFLDLDFNKKQNRTDLDFFKILLTLTYIFFTIS